MSVVSVEARSFILALFIRDDGERFLLGDNGYDFMDSQLHFVANTIENDEVEKQGVDGTMLAGQVRRSSVQSFDGYVGDATTPKSTIEQMRRDFIAFFAKGHHFRVVYVDCNRDAWQRKGGYLVDAPEVKELWQIHPEYHVGLNFEDVNYYEYDENAEGEEILANVLSVPISSEIEGGLVWDNDGAISDLPFSDAKTASGKSISVSDAVEAPLKSLEIQGETSQQTYTGKNKLKMTGATATGVTGSVNADGSYTISGKATSGNAGIIFNQAATVPAGTYTFTISQALPVVINLTFGSGLGFRLEPGQTSFTRTLPNDVTSGGQVYFAMQNGVTYDITLNWQLTPGSSADTDFEPYVGGVPAPNPDYPQAVQTVTGENVVKISDGQGNEQSYTVDLGSIELCKIGDYQDYIWKDGDTWKIHKEFGYIDLATGTYVQTTGTIRGLTSAPNIKYMPNNATLGVAICSTYKLRIGQGLGTAGVGWFAVDTSRVNFNTGSTTNPVGDLYYQLDTPTDTEITNEALIAQLEAILSQGYTYAGTNNITTVIAAGNEQGTLEVEYYSEYQDGGYVWEEGGSGGPTVVMNESISEVYPVWTVYGPAQNPILENTTNGDEIEFVGLVADGQTLIVDMGAQTAFLDGLNVISSLAGEFIALEAGQNTLLYSASNDAPNSEIGWSEIVG